jgi:hypothetical protein
MSYIYNQKWELRPCTINENCWCAAICTTDGLEVVGITHIPVGFAIHVIELHNKKVEKDLEELKHRAAIRRLEEERGE